MKTNIEIVAAAKALATKTIERDVIGVKTPGPINRDELAKKVSDAQAETEKKYKAYADEQDGATRIAMLTLAKNAADELTIALLALEIFDKQTAESESSVERIKGVIHEFGFVTHVALKGGSIAERLTAAATNKGFFTRLF